MITIEQFTELAHRTASRYSHRSEPARAFYTFSPEALADFHRQVCAASAQAQRVPDVDALADKIAECLRGTYHCNRVWEAWHVGTMSQDDFEPVDESETPREIAEEIAALLASTPAQPAQQESLCACWPGRMCSRSNKCADDVRQAAHQEPPQPSDCWCEACDLSQGNQLGRTRMSLCPECGDKRCPRAKHHDAPCQVTQAKPEQAAQPMTNAEAAVKSDRERIKAGIMALTMTAESCRGDAGVDTARKALALRIVTLIDGHGDLVLNEAGKRMAESLAEGHQ